MKHFWNILFVFIFLLFAGCAGNAGRNAGDDKNALHLVFMTDIHITSDLDAARGFQMAIDTINKLNPDAVITGGDLVMDALQATEEKADSLYDLYLSLAKGIRPPLYNTPGNHEMLGWEDEKKVSLSNPLSGDGMYRKKIGSPYYSFELKGWKFFVLNSVAHREGGYTGRVSEEQLRWLKEEVGKTDSLMPLVIVTHIPLLTGYTQFFKGATACNEEGLVVANSREVLDIFTGHNLKLVLQGHLHFLEDNYLSGIHFITGGAVSSGWWRHKYHGLEEGFLDMVLTSDKINWKYIDYGWEPKQ
jgi:3',5'-cyclic AMP phosphodiesterase CpdA